MTDYLAEQIKSIKNLCDVALILRNQGLQTDKHSLLATVLETIFKEVQEMNDEYCIDRA